MKKFDQNDIKYLEAMKRVKQLKAFYIHATVYILVNAGLILARYLQQDNFNFANIENYTTLLFWGIGLTAHGLSVYLPNIILGNDWEIKKIEEIMRSQENNRK